MAGAPAVFDDCLVCTDLWRRLAHATAENFSVESQLRRAMLDRDPQAARKLQPWAKKVSRRKIQLREAIRKHDADTHGMK